MTITGYQFDRVQVSATKDSALYNALAGGEDFVLSGQGTGLTVTASGRTVRVNTGMALIQGRLVEVTTAETLTIPANSTGYLVIEINLSQQNTSEMVEGLYTFTNNQVAVKFVSSLTTGRISDGGLLHHFALGRVVSTSTNVTFTRTAGIDNRGAGDIHAKRNIYAGGKQVQQHQLSANDGTAIKDYTSNFNDNTVSGFYHKSPSAPNAPSSLWGILAVFGGGDNLLQVFSERYSTRKIFTRTRSEGNWSSWREEVNPNHTNLTNTGWQTTGMEVTWVEYKRMGDLVVLNLTIPANTANRRLGTLPANFRPKNEIILNAPKWQSAGGQAVIQINTAGAVQVLGVGAENVHTQVTFVV